MNTEELATKTEALTKLKDISKELQNVLELFFTDYIKNDEEYIEKGNEILEDLNLYISQL